MATPTPYMGTNDSGPITEAHSLVTQLYDPANQRDPARINEIQHRIQQLQRGNHAWEIADSLLREHSTHHRFMGALTFTVKTNVSGGDIDEGATLEISQRLLNHFISIVDEGEQSMVTRKLAASLVAILRHPKATGRRILWQISASLANGSFVSEQESQAADFLGRCLPALNTQKATALLFFSIALAEEITRLETEPQDLVAPVIRRLVENIKDAFLLVRYILQQISSHTHGAGDVSMDPTLGNEAMMSWKAWLAVYGNYRHSYAHRHSCDEHTSALAVDCGQGIMEMLKSPTFSETAASILTQAFESRRWVFSPNSLWMLSQILSDSEVTFHLISFVEGNEESESMSFIELLMEYVSHLHMDLFSNPITPQNTKLLAIVHDIFKAPGYAAIDDPATPRALEYWNEIAESTPDLPSDDPRYQVVKGHLAEVVLGMFNKLLYPETSELAEWTDEERSEFNAFRYEACDYLLSAYPILGVELVSVFQESATTNLKGLNWRGFEAAMFCIAQLSEAVDENGHADQCLDAIFGSDAFAQLCTGAEVRIPLKARQTLVDTFGKYESYFERHNPLLPGVLNILFESLNFESCAQSASRSILTLSKSCCRVLVGELPVFLDQLDKFRVKPTATVSTMPKVLEGIAAIIRKLPTDEEKVQTLERILGLFVQEAHKAREEAVASAFDIARIHGHLVLGCIASVGKGLRADAEDEAINVDAQQEETPFRPSFWNAGSGSRAQQLITEVMRLLIVDFPVDMSIVDSACAILKAGYTESSGLFVFPPSLTVDFVKSFPLGTSGMDAIMTTASSFLASHASHSMQVRNEAVELILHVSDLFSSMLANPDAYDPETANAGIDFLTRLLPKYYPILFSVTDPVHSAGPYQGMPVFAATLNFTLHALTRPEPLTLRSGSAFWNAMVDLQGNSPEQTAVLDQVLEKFVPFLCGIMIQQVAGRCARSDLVFFNDVLRRVVFKKMGLARPALAAALNSLDDRVVDPNKRQGLSLSAQDKSRFLESLAVARGARVQSLELVRSFWLKCRGLSNDYVQ